MSAPIPSTLDADQCIQGSYDDATGRLRVDAEISASIIAPPGLEVAISDIDDSIKIGNGSGVYAQVTVANALKVDNSAVTQPISAASLPLPSGASTSALQTTANASLSSIDSKLTSPLSVTVGNFPAIQTVSVNNFPATQAVTQSTSPWVVSGTITANAGTNLNTSTLALESTLSSLNSKVTTVNTSSVTITSSTLPSGAATSANQTTEIVSLASIDSKLTSPLTINPITFASPQHIIVDSGTITSNIGTTGGLALDTTVSGLLTNTQLRATPVPISGTVSANNSFQTTTDTFTTTGNGVTIDSHLAPLKIFSLQVVITGTITAWDVRLEGSLDNVNFTQILQHTNTTGNGVTVYSGSLLSPSLYFRSRCSGFTGLGGSSLNAIILGVQ